MRSPILTGKICRSGPATVAVPERQDLPVTLYKNMHSIILTNNNTEQGMRFEKQGNNASSNIAKQMLH